MANMKLLADMVAVQTLPHQKETESGILLPGNVKKERPQEGVVKFVGPGKKDEPMMVKVGDRVVFGGWAEPMKIEGEEYYFISQSDIKAVIEK